MYSSCIMDTSRGLKAYILMHYPMLGAKFGAACAEVFSLFCNQKWENRTKCAASFFSHLFKFCPKYCEVSHRFRFCSNVSILFAPILSRIWCAVGALEKFLDPGLFLLNNFWYLCFGTYHFTFVTSFILMLHHFLLQNMSAKYGS